MSEPFSLSLQRQKYRPQLPKILRLPLQINIESESGYFLNEPAEIKKLFPLIHSQPKLEFVLGRKDHIQRKLRVGVVFSGGQAPGGHNVINGLLDALKKLHPKSELIGFIGGPKGIIENKHRILTSRTIAKYRNQGGFDLIGSGRDKIEKIESLQAAKKTVESLKLDGLVIIGGDDSNTNAAFLAEYFKSTGCQTNVVGIPKTIDGDLKNEDIEISFGFDTACKTYSNIIGNLMRDALSARKYYFFVKLMGRAASHVALECALQTHPNLTFISEEVAASKKTLQDIVDEISQLIVKRAESGKNYGVILIPEGLIEFIPEVKNLIKELNALLAKGVTDPVSSLGSNARHCFDSLPKDIQNQLLLSRDAHGNVQVSKIETERLLINMVENKLKKIGHKGKFEPQPYFCGYEGRSALPSNFDCNYCYALGYVAAVLIENNKTGYMCCLKRLWESPEKWQPYGIPITSMMVIEERGGQAKAVVKKALVDLHSPPFEFFVDRRKEWALDDDYLNPGPIQFFGPASIKDSITHTLLLSSLPTGAGLLAER